MSPPMRPSALALAAALALWGPMAAAQDAPAIEAPADPAPPPRKAPPRKAKPKPKATAPAPEEAKPAPDETKPAPEPVTPAAAPPPEPRPDLTVACADKAALYEGSNNFSVWVTRTGFVVIENPLRPLTPESARVLQVVIAGKVATAYGPDLFALRRGGAPAALEAATGGTLRWDATPTPLPDTLNIVSEAGQPLAQLAFQSCGDAPAVKAAPVAKARGASKAKAAARPKAPKAAPAGPPGIPLPASAL
ncbi:hypothetical protein [Methylobacterium gossipiicola]|uniref:Uncharacterized protein n=1 Tax=Methylobacterium gossipiicola TaxID=582675 RepID=A0A1I2U7G5_9HYPH|nr:hypothetical protein [Methylobacterium gossipiicola]SFG73064.1 hypothetical protein SAMN05192565_10962 [Methylobacterium gossipiicola]